MVEPRRLPPVAVPCRSRALALGCSCCWHRAAPAAATPDDTACNQFRGPLRDGTTSPAGLAVAWPASGPVERWRRPIGSGFSSVAAGGGGRAYTMDAGNGEEAVLAFDAVSR